MYFERIKTQGRTQEFVQGGTLYFFFPGNHPLGSENPLETLHFSDSPPLSAFLLTLQNTWKGLRGGEG